MVLSALARTSSRCAHLNGRSGTVRDFDYDVNKWLVALDDSTIRVAPVNVYKTGSSLRFIDIYPSPSLKRQEFLQFIPDTGSHVVPTLPSCGPSHHRRACPRVTQLDPSHQSSMPFLQAPARVHLLGPAPVLNATTAGNSQSSKRPP